MQRKKCVCSKSYFVAIEGGGEALRCRCGYYGQDCKLEMVMLGSKPYFTNREMTQAERDAVVTVGVRGVTKARDMTEWWVRHLRNVEIKARHGMWKRGFEAGKASRSK